MCARCKIRAFNFMDPPVWKQTLHVAKGISCILHDTRTMGIHCILNGTMGIYCILFGTMIIS
jgi:hypothetical protein